MNVEDLQRELDEATRVFDIAAVNLKAAKKSYEEALSAFLLGRRKQITSFQIEFPKEEKP